MIGFIGAGNMGSALLSGIIEEKKFRADELAVYDIMDKKADLLKTTFKINKVDSIQNLVENCSTIILATKPKEIKPLLSDIKDYLRDDHLLISIAAGITIKLILDILQKDIPVIRVMPNTPAKIRKGITAIASSEKARAGDIEKAVNIFSQVGETVIVKESMMDAVTALSGSGPGYTFYILESLVNAGVKAGLTREIAHNLAIQTVLGSAQLAKDSNASLADLREEVTSPGGTTAEGLRVMKEKGLPGIISEAVEAACNRSKALSC